MNSSPVHSSKERQLSLLQDWRDKCLLSMNESLVSDSEGSFCPQTWDGIYCWPHAAAGTFVVQPCPEYVYGFNPNASATKFCSKDGTWWTNPKTNRTWTNYSLCELSSDSSEESGFVVHVPVIKAISQVGYSVSLILLVIACLLLASVRRLRCPRNNLHLQLFAS
ncbi:Parathyroid hormone/parathyroid hormone-related peptide receptor, partial [Stegodyphus mimosarum]